MSTVESATMSNSDVSEKGPLDFAVKAISLKSQTDSSRILQGGPLRSLPSPSISRQQSAYVQQHPPISVIGGVSQKTVNFNRGTSGSTAPLGMATATTITSKPPLATSTVTSTTQSIHGSATYLLPRGSTPMNAAPRGSSAPGRTNVSTIQTLVRTQTSIGAQTGPVNNMRALSPGVGSTRGPVRIDAPRPIVIPGSPNRPLTLTPTTQLHITTSDKTLKVPVGSVAQVLPMRPTFCTVPTFVGQNQTTTILQRTDGVSLQAGAPATVLTTPVRLTPPLTPLIATQRVAVSVPTRLTMQQHTSITSPRPPTSCGAASRHIGPSTGPSGPSKGGASVGSGTILTTGRLGYSAGPVSVSRVMQQGSITSASSKQGTPAGQGGSRLPMPNHQPGPPTGKPRFSSTRPPNSVTSMPPSGLLVHSQIMVGGGNHLSTMRPTLMSTPVSKQIIQPSHPTSIQLTPNIVTKPTSMSGPTSGSSSQLPSPQLTPVIAKQPEMYKLTPSMPISRHGSVIPPSVGVSSGQVEQTQQLLQQQSAPSASPSQVSTVYIPSSHRPNSNSGLVTSQTPNTDRPASATTITTYTLPSGASYFYEAPSGYKLATDAPLVARPLSPDAPHVSRQLSEGPLIARPYTPGLITSTQSMRFNPVMIVDPGVASSTAFPAVTSASGDQTSANVADASATSKLSASPRPSILRKRDHEGNGNSKAIKNLSGHLGSGRSRSPSPPPAPASTQAQSQQSRAAETPPTSLHLETGQSGAEVGPSSNGSTTISATSSPGPEEGADPDRPSEMSPRKKPRKQQLNDANDPSDMEFISEERSKKGKTAVGGDATVQQDRPEIVVVKKHNNVSLLKTYKHSWKARSNHFQRHSDVKSQKEKKMSVTELASQRHIIQRIRGWKIYHCGGQFEDLSEKESDFMERFSAVKTIFEKENEESQGDKEALRITELIMGNIQRSKVFRDLMIESKAQMLKAMDHKVHVSEIVSRCASKRNFKKREKY